MILTEKLSNIADAIRSKTGKNEEMTLDEMPNEIESISGGDGSPFVIKKEINIGAAVSVTAEDYVE